MLYHEQHIPSALDLEAVEEDASDEVLQFEIQILSRAVSHVTPVTVA